MKPLLGALILSLIVVTSARSADPASNKAVDKAVERGLEFLRRTQEPSGAWKVQGKEHPAITSFAVMAFLSAGHVPGEGKYGDTVENGIRWVLKSQQVNGMIASDGGHEMYHHGICTLMLAEAAGMAPGALGDEIRKKLEKAITVILDAQRKTGRAKGGWHYRRVGTGADMSLTGWQIMALRASKDLGCDIPPTVIQDAIAYVKTCNDPVTGGFRYMQGANVTPACTGTSILALVLAGKEHIHSVEVQKAGGYMLKHKPVWRAGNRFFFYEIYYGAQATFQLGGGQWSFYKPQLHEVLLRNQQTNGAWSIEEYGPNYGTAMAILALTVEYRYLPIYQRGEEPTDKK